MRYHAPMKPDWNDIDTVLLDMDGTLLDRHFDDFFWEHHVPEQYALKWGVDVAQAKVDLLHRYRREEGKLSWTDLDFWSQELGLDIPALKEQVNHIIQVLPHVIDFLRFLRREKKTVALVTNAHSVTLDIKMRKTKIGNYFDRILCAHELGLPKEEPEFWGRLEDLMGFDPRRTMLAEDKEDNLRSARAHGIRYLVYIARPSSSLPPKASPEFFSIHDFREIIGVKQAEG